MPRSPRNRRAANVESLAALTLMTAAAAATAVAEPVIEPVVEPAAPTTPAMSPNDVAAMRRKDELVTARSHYLVATQSAKKGGGSSLVGKCARDLAKTGSTYGEVTSLATALRTIDGTAAIAWAEKYIAEKETTKSELVDKKTKKVKPAGVPTDADAASLAAFKSYVEAKRYVELADALDIFVKHSAYTYSETFTDKAKNTCKRTVDVKDDLNSMFGFRVTNQVRIAGSAEF